MRCFVVQPNQKEIEETRMRDCGRVKKLQGNLKKLLSKLFLSTGGVKTITIGNNDHRSVVIAPMRSPADRKDGISVSNRSVLFQDSSSPPKTNS